MKTKQYKRFITIGLFIVLCLIDYITSSLDGMTQQIARNFVSVALLGVLFVNLEKPSRGVIVVASGMVCVLVGYTAITSVALRGDLVRLKEYLGFLPICCAVSAVIVSTFRMNKETLLIFIKNRFIWLYLALYIFIAVSRSDSKWPLTMIPLVLCLGLEISSEDRISELFHELNLGIIISFFLIQGCAFVFRPYDVVRYAGMYTYCNINALFYLCTFVAFLCETFYGDNIKYKWWRVICMIMAPVCIGFTIFTVCRTAVIAEGLVCIALLIVYIFRKISVKKLILNVVIFAMAFLLSFPIVYCAIRYIPAVFHHPIWLWDEYSESKVHSFDPIDSEKYISGKEAGVELVRRFLWFSDSAMEWVKKETPNAEPVSDVVEEIEVDARIQELLDAGVVPVLSAEESLQADSVRIGIWKGYIKMLNMQGHKKAEGELLLEEDYIAPHAHNVFIMSAFDYGILAGVVFCIVAILTLAKGIYLVFKRKEEYLGVVVLLNAVAFFAFGFFETNWGLGKMSILVFALLQIISINAKGENGVNKL